MQFSKNLGRGRAEAPAAPPPPARFLRAYIIITWISIVIFIGKHILSLRFRGAFTIPDIYGGTFL